jgi:signal transduction histidine kinase/CheY-like chemotaxis protein
MRGLLIFIWTIVSNYSIGQVVITEKSKFPISIHKESHILDLGFEKIKIDQILARESQLDFNPLTSPVTNLGFTNRNYWVQFTLSNETREAKTYYLETGRPITDVVDLYQVRDGQVIKTTRNGDLISFHDRPFKHRKLIFPIEIDPNSQASFHLNYQSDGEVINLPLVLNDAVSLVESSYFDQLIFGFFYGILFLAAITYLFFYLGIREKSILLYSSYVVSIALLHLSLDGFLIQFIFTEPTWFANRSLLVFAAFSAFAFGRYTQVYIRVAEFSPVLNKIFQFVLAGLILLTICILGLEAGRPVYYPIVNAFALTLLILSIVAIVKSHLAKVPIDRFFTIGITFLILGFIIFILNNFSLIPNSFLTENASKIGTGIEIIFLSLSMANRIRLLKSEKEQMQEIALQRSEESNEIKSYFLSNMSHELRTPLNAILGLSNSILSETNDPKIKSDLEVIQYSSLSLLTSINDILDYSKIEKGELKLAHLEFDFHKLIQELKAVTNQQARDKSLDFIYEERNSLPKKLIGDSTRFKQIFTNVIGNALKFTNKGQIKFSVQTEELDDEKIEITAIIEDSGVGITKEKLDRIFESFIQEELNDTRKYGGFGLGLCIVKALVELHEGRIQVESDQESGTTVTLKMKLLKAVTENITEDQILLQAADLLNGKNLLVVEDNPVNQLVIKSILRKWKGITFDFANHGLEALQAMEVKKYDLILMDLQMPEMDGYEATQLIRSGKSGINNPNIPIIAVTADTTEKTKIRVMEIGMDAYIPKPIDQELLHTSVLRALYLEKVKINLID